VFTDADLLRLVKAAVARDHAGFQLDTIERPRKRGDRWEVTCTYSVGPDESRYRRTLTLDESGRVLAESDEEPVDL
jgi:hypothetical protein